MGSCAVGEAATTQGSGERGCQLLYLDGTIFVPAALVIQGAAEKPDGFQHKITQ
jgi:hypothetical protein